MSRVIAGMTMSIDGYVNDPRGSVEALYRDLDELRNAPYMKELVDATGAVVMGRRAFEMAEDPDWYVGNYEFQVPIVVVTHRAPARIPKQDERLTFAFVDGIAAAVATAKAAAKDRAVQVIGASVVRQVLNEGLADELQVEIMPVVLGGGLRFLEGIAANRVGLEMVGVRRFGPRTRLSYRVVPLGA